ncbi:hypothetical protein [Stieleria varia]|uniref:Leucine Rich repeats (2 copies) n=1 Tax=Stieleria varia TaxID=2528005 RepID=A0A5C6AG97_9BACT|nr:hypothetical protein [Stieleria varia]TWT98426.1 hypothetical protein Pla52n_49400 [Stieleria varia]
MMRLLSSRDVAVDRYDTIACRDALSQRIRLSRSIETTIEIPTLSHAKRLWRFLIPAPMDAWILAALGFWLLALVGSVYWYADLPYLDPIELPMPPLYALIASSAGLCLAVVLVPIERKVVAIYFLTVVAGLVIFLFAGRWLNVHEANWAYHGDPRREQTELSLPEFWARYRWPLTGLLGTFATTILISLLSIHVRWFEKVNGWLVKMLSRVGSYLNRHRQRLMIGFAVVMFPATVLRNAIDTELQSHRYVVGFFTVMFAVFAFLVSLYFVLRYFLNRRWMALKAICLIGLVTAVSAFWIIQAFSQPIRLGYLENCIEIVMWSTIPFFFIVAFLVPLWTAESSDGSKHHLVSVWSLVLSTIAVCSTWFALQRYDPLTIASSALESVSVNPRPPSWELLSVAEESRRIQKLTDGAARLFSSNGSLGLYVNVRGERDADCLHRLISIPPPGIRSITIENLQPFVDTKPLRSYSGHVGILSREITAEQMEDLCHKTTSLAFCDAKLPDRNESGVTLPPFVTTYSTKPIPGFADFIDAYAGTRKRPFYLNAPLTMDDWNAVLRANQRCSFCLYDLQYLPAGASTSAEIAKQSSLSGVSLMHLHITELDSDLVRLLETDLRFVGVSLDDAQTMWDLAFSNPKIRCSPFKVTGETLPFGRAVKEYHWAYGWNEQNRITKLWLPDIDQLDKNASELDAVTTLRFDRRGFIGFRVFQALDFSPLGKLPQLQRLYLGSGEYFGDLRFLAKLPKLVHLQIQAQNRSTMKSSGYEVCTNLESIRFFGTPQQQAIKELAGLSKLKRLEIVDDDSSFVSESEVSALKEQLPGVDIQIISPEQFQPDLSDALKEHLESVRKAVNQLNQPGTEHLAGEFSVSSIRYH